MSRNGYASFTRNSIIKPLKHLQKRLKKKDDTKIVWTRLPHFGNIGDNMIKENAKIFKRKCLFHNLS